MNFLIVGIGGIAGSLTRFSLGNFINKKFKSLFPLGTFIINITGALLLGILSSSHISRSFYILLCDGFLGAYTTFSSFMYEDFKLFKLNYKLHACTYVIMTTLIGLAFYALGTTITYYAGF